VFIFEEKCTILTADLSFLVENIVQWQVVEGLSELTFIASVYDYVHEIAAVYGSNAAAAT